MDEDGQVIGVATLLSAEGQNLNFAIAVEAVSAALVQPQSEPFSGPAVAIATPTIDAYDYYQNRLGSLSKKEYDKAIGDFTELTRLVPDDFNAYHNRGLAYDNLNKYEQAIADYTEAIRLKPDYNDSDLSYRYLITKNRPSRRIIGAETNVL
jgi:tetratricopeptide (TPR) repeat protein